MSASLVHGATRIPLPHDVNIVGRDPATCDVVLADGLSVAEVDA